MKTDLDLGDFQKQADSVEEELFRDLDVSYKVHAYVGVPSGDGLPIAMEVFQDP